MTWEPKVAFLQLLCVLFFFLSSLSRKIEVTSAQPSSKFSNSPLTLCLFNIVNNLSTGCVSFYGNIPLKFSCIISATTVTPTLGVHTLRLQMKDKISVLLPCFFHLMLLMEVAHRKLLKIECICDADGRAACCTKHALH